MLSRTKEYFVPFLILVGSAIGFILLVRFLYLILFPIHATSDSFTIARAFLDVKKLEWGNEKWIVAQEGDTLLHGDRLRTYEGRAEINRHDTVYVRMDSLTEMMISDIATFPSSFSSQYIKLIQGTLWINALNDYDELSYEVDSFLITLELPSIFQIRAVSDSIEFDVFEGSIVVQYFSGVNQIMRFSLPASSGATFSQEDITDIVLGIKKHGSFLRPIDEQIFISPWGEWNRNNDAVTKSKISHSTTSYESTSGLQILFPEDGVQISENAFELRGLVSSHAHDIIVYTFLSGEQEEYRLRKFKPGDKEWVYRVSTEYGNLVSGENVYKIVAFDERGDAIGQDEVRIVKK